MKKLSIFPALFLIVLINIGYAQNKKIAVVTFFINKQIDVTEFGGVAYLAVTKLSDDPNFNLAPLLKSFHAQFFDDYSKSFPFQLLSETQVINNDAYKAFVPVGVADNGVLKASNYITTVDGYKIILPLVGHDNEKALLKIFNESDGVMDVSIDFKLIKIGLAGMGIIKVDAFANIALFNKNGDRVFSLKEDAKSKSTNALIGGVPVMTADKIMPMCESALNELMTQLQKDMPKLIKKADAKL